MTVVFISDSSLAPGCASCWAARSGSLGRPRVAPVSDSAGAEHRGLRRTIPVTMVTDLSWKFSWIDDQPGHIGVGSFCDQRVHELAVFLEEGRDPNMSWRDILNCHTTQGSWTAQDRLCPSISDCFDCRASGSASAGGTEWTVALFLPNTYRAGDGRALEVVASGETKTVCISNACWLVLTVLLLREPEGLRILPAHWRVPWSEIVEQAKRLTQDLGQALPAPDADVEMVCADAGSSSSGNPTDPDSGRYILGSARSLGATPKSGQPSTPRGLTSRSLGATSKSGQPSTLDIQLEEACAEWSEEERMRSDADLLEGYVDGYAADGYAAMDMDGYAVDAKTDSDSGRYTLGSARGSAGPERIGNFNGNPTDPDSDRYTPGSARGSAGPEYRFQAGQSVLQWWANWFKNTAEPREHYKKKERPSWYSGEILNPGRYVEDLPYAGELYTGIAYNVH